MFVPEPNVILVWVGPAPLSVTLLLLVYIDEPLIVQFPAGIRTTVLFGAEASAAVMLAAVTVPPNNVVHCVVAQFAHVELGIPPGIPAYVQSVARDGARMPCHACPYENEENRINVEIRGERCLWRLIILRLQLKFCRETSLQEECTAR